MFKDQFTELYQRVTELLQSSSIPCNLFKPSLFKQEPGVVAFFDLQDRCLLITSTGNVRRKAYINEYQGDASTSRLKRRLIEDNDMMDITSFAEAKDWLRDNVYCKVSYTSSIEECSRLEGGLAFLLEPLYVAYK